MRYILEAKLGMSDQYEIIGEFATLKEAIDAQNKYSYDQISSDLYADSNIIDINELNA